MIENINVDIEWNGIAGYLKIGTDLFAILNVM